MIPCIILCSLGLTLLVSPSNLILILKRRGKRLEPRGTPGSWTSIYVPHPTSIGIGLWGKRRTSVQLEKMYRPNAFKKKTSQGNLHYSKIDFLLKLRNSYIRWTETSEFITYLTYCRRNCHMVPRSHLKKYWYGVYAICIYTVNAVYMQYAKQCNMYNAIYTW